MRLFVLLLSAFPFLSQAVPTVDVGVKIPLAKRSRVTNSDGVVRVDVLRSELVKVRSKIQRAFAAFEKNTGASHPNDKGNITNRGFELKRATGADALTDDEGALWQGTVSVGTPAVTFTVDFDTGSSDFFLPATDCTVNCAGHKLWNTAASSTARSQNKPFSLAFADGSTVQGTVFTDTVTLAGLTATGQAVGASTQYSDGFAIAEFPPDGLLGMAFPQISVFGDNPVFQTLVAQGKTTTPEFAVKLSTSGSELFLGGVDNNLFTGTFTQNPVTEVGFWQINLQSVNVNGRSVVTGLSSIVDTGTTLILGDANSVAEVYAAVPGSKNASATVGEGFFTVPCNAIPAISLTFGGKAFTVSAATFNLGRVSAQSNDCVGGLAAFDIDFWVAGDVFLQNVYTSFNVQTQQVGFATLR